MNETGRRLLWALGLSLILHFALLFGMRIELPQPVEETPLKVTLLELPRPAPPTPAPVTPKPRPAPVRSTASEPKPAPPQPEPAAIADAPEPAAPTPAPRAIAEAVPKLAEAPPSVPTPPPPPPLTPLPKRITLAYDLYKGSQRFNVGRMTHIWQMAGNQYTLTSIAEASGLASLFLRGALIQVSRGEMTPYGLQPQEFWIQRGQSGDRTESASFDWGMNLLRYGKANEQKTQALAPGAQDVLSVLYQLALTAPHTGTVKLSITNGRKFDRYAYRLVGEEWLETPLGKLQTQHLTRVVAADEDKLDVWLAKDYHYLPVRLYLIDHKGGEAEQLVTAIRGE